MGKIGVQLTIVGMEIEGPNFAIAANSTGLFVQISVFRIELQFCIFGIRIEPNINTSVGIQNEQFKLKIIGFGFSAGLKGLGIHTPFGSTGIGRF